MAYTTINKHTDYFNTKLYTGTNAVQNVTGVGHQPDLVWIKDRSGTNSGSHNHNLIDAVRGAPKILMSDTNAAEITNSTDALTAFISDGFTLGANNAGDQSQELNGHTNGGNQYVSWNWKAGGGQGSSNTDGTINTTYTSVNTTAGFSISKYVGTGSVGTIGHGLGAVPKMIIVKKIEHAKDWRIYHASTGNTKQLFLNDTGAQDDDNTIWNDTSPTSSVFTVGTNDGGNGVGNTYIAYCFAEKTGYSKFGTFKGNGQTDGTFVYTGFKPNFVITKKSSGTADWMIRDNKRDFNGQWRDLYANNTNAETSPDSNTQSDLLSNGFKLRMSHSNHNESGGDYVYMAFGQSLVGSNNVPCTAR